MTEQLSNYLNDNENQIDLFDDDDEDTREFYLLEQKIKENDEEQLFNILSKQVEQISSVKLDDDVEYAEKVDLEQNDSNFILKNEDDLNKINNEIILRTKKKISFDANSYENETKTSHLFSRDQEIKDLKINRPLTIYIPSTKQDLDLIAHLTTLGHDIEHLKQYVQLMPTMCSGHLWKESYNSGIWIKRYFVFDRTSKLFIYFKSFKNYYKQKQPKGAIPFEDIKNVYPDHIRNVEKIPKYTNFNRKTRSIFIVKTVKRDLVLSTFYPELMRFWIDIIFTGAEAHENFF